MTLTTSPNQAANREGQWDTFFGILAFLQSLRKATSAKKTFEKNSFSSTQYEH